MNFQWFDLLLLLLFGLLGLAMRRFGIPVLPLIIGVILGPSLEYQLSQALALSSGDVSTLWSEPAAVLVYIVILAGLAAVVFTGLRSRKRTLIDSETKEEETV